MARTFHIFAECDFSELEGSLLAKLKSKIYSENPNYILNVNETEYLDYASSEFGVQPLELGIDNKTVSPFEQNIPAASAGEYKINVIVHAVLPD